MTTLLAPPVSADETTVPAKFTRCATGTAVAVAADALATMVWMNVPSDAELREE